MSHDLKTPLSVVLGLSETLTYDQTISDAEQIRLLRKIYDKAQVMQQLINDFFDLAKLESGDKKLTLIPTALNEICSNNLLFLHEQITTKGLDVSVEIPDEPMVASIDPTALDRVLQNLLANAISYGNDGKMIGIRLRANETLVFIDVWDRGKGIPEQEQSLIFDRLYTLEDSRNRAYQGSGLGLTITKRLVESMGGNLSVKSQPFVETVFTVQLNRSFSHASTSSGERLS
jgi:signal transduction histidine kinase